MCGNKGGEAPSPDPHPLCSGPRAAPSGMAISGRPSFSAGVDPRLHLEATFRFQRQDAFNYIKIEPLTLSKMTPLSFRLKCQNYTTLSVKRTI